MSHELTPLSTGAIAKIIKGEECVFPVFQIMTVGRVKNNNEGTPGRLRFHIWDGQTKHPFAIFNIEQSQYQPDDFSEFTIIRVDRYMCSVINRNDSNERRVMIIYECEVLHPGNLVGRIIGNPPSNDVKSESDSAPSAQKENMNGNSAQPARNQYQKQLANVSLNSSSANLSEHLTMPINGLSPYQNKWVIKARVTAKSNIRTWNNAKGEGKLFSFDLCDETGEIRATAFNQQVEKFFDMLEVDKVYYITKCQLKPANKMYSKLNNEYEMSLGNETEIQECTEATGIPAIQYKFVKISEIASKEANDTVDVVAVVKDVNDAVNITSKAGKNLTKREITLIDNSNASITLTLWGEEALAFEGSDQPVVVIKSARVGEYNGGKTLGTFSSTVIKKNPDVPEGHLLRGWFDNGGSSGDVQQLSARGIGNFGPAEWVDFHAAKLKNLGAGEKADVYQVKGFIHNIRSSNAFYKACPNDKCNKKVTDNEDGSYKCEKCQSTTTNFKYRLLVNMLVGDWIGNRWVTAFSETAEALFGKSAEEIGSMLEHDSSAAENLFSGISFQQKVLKLRSKVEHFNDITKNKVTVLSVSDPDLKEFHKHLSTNIQRLTGIGFAPQN